MRDVDFLRRRVVLHENAVAVGGRTHVGTLKTGHSRTVALPAFVVDESAVTCANDDFTAIATSYLKLCAKCGHQGVKPAI